MVQFTDFDTIRNAADNVPILLDDVRVSCDLILNDLRAAYGWSDEDWRMVTVNRLRNVIQSALAVRVFQWVIFPNDNFWKTFFEGVPSPNQMADHFRELDMMARFAALHGMFSALEADVRTIVSRIDPNACGGGKATFDSIVKWLLARATSAAQYFDFIEVLRLTRNTIHNNGVHRPTNGQNVTIQYKGKTFLFVVDQPIDFAGWDFVAFVGNEILGLLRTLVTDQAIVGLPSV
jgi:hypothetical protein